MAENKSIHSKGVKQEDTNDVISIFVSGDFCPVFVQKDVFLKGTAVKDIFGNLYETICDIDFSITNLECPLTASDESIKKIGPNLKAVPDVAALLKNANFDMVTLANNHIFDYGQRGLSDTLKALERNKLSYVGAGLTLDEARKPFYLEMKGIKLAIVNFAEIEYACANVEHGGANPMNLIDNFHQIQEARSNADHLMVIVHGGHEQYHYPSPMTLKRYRFYAEAGASVVIAHHTHCIGGYEQYKGVPIFYSLGNFFFPMRHDMPALWHEGYALLLNITKHSLAFEILPYEQCKGATLSIDRSQSKAILKKIEEISSTISDDKQIEAQWAKFAEERYRDYLAMISGFGKYKIAILRRFGLIDCFYRKSQLESIRQIIRCEAHKEVAVEVLSSFLKGKA